MKQDVLRSLFSDLSTYDLNQIICNCANAAEKLNVKRSYGLAREKETAEAVFDCVRDIEDALHDIVYSRKSGWSTKSYT